MLITISNCRLLVVTVQFLSLARAFPLEKKSTTLGKRGLAYNSASLAGLFQPYPEVTWGYNWNFVSEDLSSELEYVPLLYSDPTGNAAYISAWEGNVSSGIKSGSIHHLLAFNEPDVNNLSPAQAATAYQKYLQPYASSAVQLGAPAVTNGGPPTGLTWLQEFLGNCSGCTIDFVPFHWYCYYDDISYFTNYVEQAYFASGKKPLWITEFQGDNLYCDNTATDLQQAEFMNTILPWLDSLSYVSRYAYFGVFETSASQAYLLNESGTGFSQSGQVYATLTKVNSTTPTALVD